MAVSGGADSVALFRLLLELREELGIVPGVVHFNHKLRGAESDADEEFVRELAAKNNAPFVSSGADVKAHAADKKVSLEAAGRELRYEFFGRLMLAGEFDKIATAHTLDDQAETVLLKLTRGAGTRGLAGIYPRVNVRPSMSEETVSPSTACGAQAIVRPLLGTRRASLEEYLHELKQPWREDSSNRDLRHTRNRVRHEILPLLESLINPRIRECLNDAAEIARAEEEYWAQQSQLLAQQAWEIQNGRGMLDVEFLHAQPLAVQRRLIRTVTESLGLPIEFHHVEKILALDHENAETALPAGWTAALHKGAIHIGPHRDGTDRPYEYQLRIPGRITVPEASVVIETRVVAAGESISEALLDRTLAGTNLTVRSWQPGDRFWPSYSKSPQKVKDLLQTRHITGEEKKRWPVIASGDEIVWVRDLGVRKDFQAKNGPGVFIRATPLNS